MVNLAKENFRVAPPMYLVETALSNPESAVTMWILRG